jgi:DNA-binding transcriptional ArsR family regulator
MGRPHGAEPAPPVTADDIPVLPEHVPVTLPALAPHLLITTAEQFKAINEPTRSRILSIIQNEPATAKQLADRLHVPHGAIGHHLQVLEATGLAQIVAKRLVRGFVAKYYARTARLFTYDLSPDVVGGRSPSVEIVTQATTEFAETVAEGGAEARTLGVSFPRMRLSPARAIVYQERLAALVEELLREPPDPEGEVYSCLVALFRSPNYLQSDSHLSSPAREADAPVAPRAEIDGEADGEAERQTNQAHQQDRQAGDTV